MSHEAIQELLSSYLDGDLSADERGQVDEHLATCEACQQELALLRATLDALHGLPELTAPAGFADAVMDRVLAEAPTVGATVVPLRRRLPVLLMAAPAALAAAAVLMVGMVWWLAPRYQAGEPGVVASRGDAAEQEEKAAASGWSFESADGDAAADAPAAEPEEIGNEADVLRRAREKQELGPPEAALAAAEVMPAPVEAEPRLAERESASTEALESGLGGVSSGGLATGSARGRGGAGSAAAPTGAAGAKDSRFVPWEESSGADMDGLADVPAAPTATERQQLTGGEILGGDGFYKDIGGADGGSDPRVGTEKPRDEVATAAPAADPGPPESAGFSPIPEVTVEPDELGAAMDGIVDTSAAVSEDEGNADRYRTYADEEDDGEYSRYDQDDGDFRAVEVISEEREARKARAESVSRSSGRRSADKRDERRGGGPGKAKKTAEAPAAEDAEFAPEPMVEDEVDALASTPARDSVAQAGEMADCGADADADACSSGSARWTLQTTNDQVLAQLDTLCDGTTAVSCRFVAGGTGAAATGDDASDPVVTIELSRGAYDSWKQALGRLGALDVRAESLGGLGDDAPVILSLTIQVRP